MKNFFTRISIQNTLFTLIVMSVLLLGLFIYVGVRLYGLEKENKEKSEKITQIDQQFKDLQNLLLTTASSLQGVLEQEQARNSSLKEELEDITDAVGILERVSTTDRDLLKKYSKTYFLNENYVPLDLTPISEKYQSGGGSNFQILSDVWPYLKDLLEEAGEDDLSLQVLSAYRSFAAQSALKSNYTVLYGSGANAFSADQGYSEHQMGTTVDFTTLSSSGTLNGFDKTPEYEWLLDNAHKYGFILSYPPDNAYYRFEPWHWRFVGVKLAEKLHDDNMYFYDMDQREIDTYLVNIFD